MSLSTDWEDGIVVNRVSGKVDVDALVAFVKENVKSWKDADVIWDFSEARLGEISLADCLGVLSSTEPDVRIRKGRRAALVSRQALHGSMLNLVSSLARQKEHPVQLKAFSDCQQAEAWLRRAE